MENKNTTDETFNTVIEPHNHRAIIGFDKNGIPKVLVPVSGHTHKHIDENGNEYEHSHEEVFTEDYRKAVSAYRKTFPTNPKAAFGQKIRLVRLSPPWRPPL